MTSSNNTTVVSIDDLNIGDEIEVFSPLSKNWKKASVAESDDDKEILVHFENDAQRWINVGKSQIRLIQSTSINPSGLYDDNNEINIQMDTADVSDIIARPELDDYISNVILDSKRRNRRSRINVETDSNESSASEILDNGENPNDEDFIISDEEIADNSSTDPEKQSDDEDMKKRKSKKPKKQLKIHPVEKSSSMGLTKVKRDPVKHKHTVMSGGNIDLIKFERLRKKKLQLVRIKKQKRDLLRMKNSSQASVNQKKPSPSRNMSAPSTSSPSATSLLAQRLLNPPVGMDNRSNSSPSTSPDAIPESVSNQIIGDLSAVVEEQITNVISNVVEKKLSSTVFEAIKSQLGGVSGNPMKQGAKDSFRNKAVDSPSKMIMSVPSKNETNVKKEPVAIKIKRIRKPNNVEKPINVDKPAYLIQPTPAVETVAKLPSLKIKLTRTDKSSSKKEIYKLSSVTAEDSNKSMLDRVKIFTKSVPANDTVIEAKKKFSTYKKDQWHAQMVKNKSSDEDSLQGWIKEPPNKKPRKSLSCKPLEIMPKNDPSLLSSEPKRIKTMLPKIRVQTLLPKVRIPFASPSTSANTTALSDSSSSPPQQGNVTLPILHQSSTPSPAAYGPVPVRLINSSSTGTSGFICPKADCKKQFRSENLLMMHIKHYHREYTKLLSSMPNVADLAYARTVGETIPTHQSEFLQKISQIEEDRMKELEQNPNISRMVVDDRVNGEDKENLIETVASTSQNITTSADNCVTVVSLIHQNSGHHCVQNKKEFLIHQIYKNLFDKGLRGVITADTNGSVSDIGKIAPRLCNSVKENHVKRKEITVSDFGLPATNLPLNGSCIKFAVQLKNLCGKTRNDSNKKHVVHKDFVSNVEVCQSSEDDSILSCMVGVSHCKMKNGSCLNNKVTKLKRDDDAVEVCQSSEDDTILSCMVGVSHCKMKNGSCLNNKVTKLKRDDDALYSNLYSYRVFDYHSKDVENESSRKVMKHINNTNFSQSIVPNKSILPISSSSDISNKGPFSTDIGNVCESSYLEEKMSSSSWITGNANINTDTISSCLISTESMSSFIPSSTETDNSEKFILHSGNQTTENSFNINEHDKNWSEHCEEFSSKNARISDDIEDSSEIVTPVTTMSNINLDTGEENESNHSKKLPPYNTVSTNQSINAKHSTELVHSTTITSNQSLSSCSESDHLKNLLINGIARYIINKIGTDESDSDSSSNFSGVITNSLFADSYEFDRLLSSTTISENEVDNMEEYATPVTNSEQSNTMNEFSQNPLNITRSLCSYQSDELQNSKIYDIDKSLQVTKLLESSLADHSYSSDVSVNSNNSSVKSVDWIKSDSDCLSNQGSSYIIDKFSYNANTIMFGEDKIDEYTDTSYPDNIVTCFNNPVNFRSYWSDVSTSESDSFNELDETSNINFFRNTSCDLVPRCVEEEEEQVNQLDDMVVGKVINQEIRLEDPLINKMDDIIGLLQETVHYESEISSREEMEESPPVELDSEIDTVIDKKRVLICESTETITSAHSNGVILGTLHTKNTCICNEIVNVESVLQKNICDQNKNVNYLEECGIDITHQTGIEQIPKLDQNEFNKVNVRKQNMFHETVIHNSLITDTSAKVVINDTNSVINCVNIGSDSSDIITDCSDIDTDGSDINTDGVDMIPDRADIIPDRADIIPDGADIIPDRADIIPNMTDIGPYKIDIGPDSADIASDSVSVTDSIDIVSVINCVNIGSDSSDIITDCSDIDTDGSDINTDGVDIIPDRADIGPYKIDIGPDSADIASDGVSVTDSIGIVINGVESIKPDPDDIKLSMGFIIDKNSVLIEEECHIKSEISDHEDDQVNSEILDFDMKQENFICDNDYECHFENTVIKAEYNSNYENTEQVLDSQTEDVEKNYKTFLRTVSSDDDTTCTIFSETADHKILENKNEKYSSEANKGEHGSLLQTFYSKSKVIDSEHCCDVNMVNDCIPSEKSDSNDENKDEVCNEDQFTYIYVDIPIEDTSSNQPVLKKQINVLNDICEVCDDSEESNNSEIDLEYLEVNDEFAGFPCDKKMYYSVNRVMRNLIRTYSKIILEKTCENYTYLGKDFMENTVRHPKIKKKINRKLKENKGFVGRKRKITGLDVFFGFRTPKKKKKFSCFETEKHSPNYKYKKTNRNPYRNSATNCRTAMNLPAQKDRVVYNDNYHNYMAENNYLCGKYEHPGINNFEYALNKNCKTRKNLGIKLDTSVLQYNKVLPKNGDCDFLISKGYLNDVYKQKYSVSFDKFSATSYETIKNLGIQGDVKVQHDNEIFGNTDYDFSPTKSYFNSKHDKQVDFSYFDKNLETQTDTEVLQHNEILSDNNDNDSLLKLVNSRIFGNITQNSGDVCLNNSRTHVSDKLKSSVSETITTTNEISGRSEFFSDVKNSITCNSILSQNDNSESKLTIPFKKRKLQEEEKQSFKPFKKRKITVVSSPVYQSAEEDNKNSAASLEDLFITKCPEFNENEADIGNKFDLKCSNSVIQPHKVDYCNKGQNSDAEGIIFNKVYTAPDKIHTFEPLIPDEMHTSDKDNYKFGGKYCVTSVSGSIGSRLPIQATNDTFETSEYSVSKELTDNSAPFQCENQVTDQFQSKESIGNIVTCDNYGPHETSESSKFAPSNQESVQYQCVNKQFVDSLKNANTVNSSYSDDVRETSYFRVKSACTADEKIVFEKVNISEGDEMSCDAIESEMIIRNYIQNKGTAVFDNDHPKSYKIETHLIENTENVAENFGSKYKCTEVIESLKIDNNIIQHTNHEHRTTEIIDTSETEKANYVRLLECTDSIPNEIIHHSASISSSLDGICDITPPTHNNCSSSDVNNDSTKKVQCLKCEDQEQESDVFFFHSILPQVKNLTVERKVELKTIILDFLERNQNTKEVTPAVKI